MAVKSLCSIPGCGKVGKLRRGWCGKHYERWRGHGDPLAASVRPYRESREYLQKVVLQFSGDDCLIWPFRRDKIGYARIDLNARNMIASRIICEEVHGPAPSGMDAAHSCGNGHLGCVNPRHLSWKTHAENMADMVRHGRSTRGDRNAQAKIGERDAIFIRSQRGKMTQEALAKMFGLHQSHISDIQAGKRWAHIRTS